MGNNCNLSWIIIILIIVIFGFGNGSNFFNLNNSCGNDNNCCC